MKSNYLRQRARHDVTIPRDAIENKRTEREEARRATRDWLRDRTEDDVIDFENEPKESAA